MCCNSQFLPSVVLPLVTEKTCDLQLCDSAGWQQCVEGFKQMKQTEILIQATGVFKCIVMILQIVKGRKERSKVNREKTRMRVTKRGTQYHRGVCFPRDYCEIEFGCWYM